jgi:hypothetical protein
MKKNEFSYENILTCPEKTKENKRKYSILYMLFISRLIKIYKIFQFNKIYNK